MLVLSKVKSVLVFFGLALASLFRLVIQLHGIGKDFGLFHGCLILRKAVFLVLSLTPHVRRLI